MKTRWIFIISLVLLCCLSWSISVAAKSDPGIKQAQKRLRELGYDPGLVDGKMGKKSEEALKSFQQDNGLLVTGKLDRATKQRLGIPLNVAPRTRNISFSIGGELWYPGIDVPGYRGRDVNIDPGFTWGPIIFINFANNWWVSGMFLTGTYDYGPVGEDFYRDWYEKRGGELKSQDAEVVVGRFFNFFDIGGGLRYTAWKRGAKTGGREEQDITTYGPMVYLGASPTLGKTPGGGLLGGYLGASWVFAELGNEEDTEHVNFEGGIFFIQKKLKGTLGYRYKNYYKLYENYGELDGDSLIFKGFIGSLSYLF